MDQLRVGFIGLGGIAGAHLKVLSGLEGVQVVALCDVNQAAVDRRAAQTEGAATFTDYRDMLAKGSLDACFVCVPPFAHAHIEEDLASAGVPFFVEKPVELSMERAAEKARAVASAGLLTAVGYCARYSDSADEARLRLADRQVELALGYYMGGAGGGWWQDRSRSGGQLVEQSTHIVDLARYLVGDVERVSAGFSTLTRPNDDYTVDNNSIVTLYYKSGAVGSITSSCMLSQGFKCGLDLFARDLALEYTYGALRVRSPQGVEEFKGTSDMYEREDRAFLDSLSTGDRSLVRCDYADGVKSLEISLAADEAARDRRVVPLRFGL